MISWELYQGLYQGPTITSTAASQNAESTNTMGTTLAIIYDYIHGYRATNSDSEESAVTTYESGPRYISHNVFTRAVDRDGSTSVHAIRTDQGNVLLCFHYINIGSINLWFRIFKVVNKFLPLGDWISIRTQITHILWALCINYIYIQLRIIEIVV